MGVHIHVCTCAHTRARTHTPPWGGRLWKRACPQYAIPSDGNLEVQPHCCWDSSNLCSPECLTEKLLLPDSPLADWAALLPFKGRKRWLPLGFLFHGARQRALSPLQGGSPAPQPPACCLLPPCSLSSAVPGKAAQAHEAPPALLTQPGPGAPRAPHEAKGLTKTPRQAPLIEVQKSSASPTKNSTLGATEWQPTGPAWPLTHPPSRFPTFS